MDSDSIVVMESGASWPAWVDQEAGAVSNVVVLARQPGESLSDFEERARRRIESTVEVASPRRGVLVCGAGTSRELSSSRTRIVKALLEIVRRSGGGDVVLVGQCDDRLELQLTSYARKLNLRDREATGLVRVRFRAAPETARAETRVA